jgi:hypothetical protein
LTENYQKNSNYKYWKLCLCADLWSWSGVCLGLFKDCPHASWIYKSILWHKWEFLWFNKPKGCSIVWTFKTWNEETLIFYNLLHPISITVLVMFETSFSMFASSNHSRWVGHVHILPSTQQVVMLKVESSSSPTSNF